MVHPFQGTHVMTIQNDFSHEFLPLPLDLIMLHHDDNQVHIVQERIKVMVLIRDESPLHQRIIYLQRFRQMPFLALEKLQRRTLPPIIHVLLLGQSI